MGVIHVFKYFWLHSIYLLLCLMLIVCLGIYSSVTANTEQLYCCYPPWFEDTPHWQSNRHASSYSPTCDCSQTPAKWTTKIWRCLVVERRSKCMSLIAKIHIQAQYCTRIDLIFCCHFLLSCRSQRVTSRGRMGLKWSTRPSGLRRCQMEWGGHLFQLNRYVTKQTL